MARCLTKEIGGNAMEGATGEFLRSLKASFADLKDPRIQASCDHLLIDILAITILGVTCGADDWTDLETFGKLRHEWLKTFLKLPNGIPSHDTFRRVLGLLDRQQFSVCLFRWTQAIHEATGGKLIALDGKALRRSFAKKSGKAMLHLVTAWSSENGLTLGQIACEEKSNEITAIPELLKLLNLRGCTVTIDAMGCQKEIARQIREQKGHYVLALKGNQSSLQEDMQALAEEAIDTDFADVSHGEYESSETGHGRTDHRTCHVIEIPRNHRQRSVWKHLRTLVLMTCCRLVNGKESWETRLYVSSHPPRAKMLATAIRRHWGIENGQHWVLDVCFGEDARRQQDRNGGVNLAAVRRLAVSLLRQDTTIKRGAKCKRMACALDPCYLLRVFQNATIGA
jgi:predicted transposase YbfD/YdcC